MLPGSDTCSSTPKTNIISFGGGGRRGFGLENLGLEPRDRREVKQAFAWVAIARVPGIRPAPSFSLRAQSAEVFLSGSGQWSGISLVPDETHLHASTLWISREI